MLPQEIIRKKREGQPVDPAEIAFLVEGLTHGAVTEGQVAAFAMAVFFRGMSRAEAVALTLAMRDSGAVLDWTGLEGPVLDKHSTGGVGDNVSLMLAPAIAACGGFVPMISGRGLGHTGGTLDKLDAIPGYTSQPDIETFRKVVEEVGCAIIGQTADLAPADKRFYAIRDVTATVESVPLITASMLSKKLAAGLDALVLDVKTGSGAFMATREARQRAGRKPGLGRQRCGVEDRRTDHRHGRAAGVGRRQRRRGPERRRIPHRPPSRPPPLRGDRGARRRTPRPGWPRRQPCRGPDTHRGRLCLRPRRRDVRPDGCCARWAQPILSRSRRATSGRRRWCGR